MLVANILLVISSLVAFLLAMLVIISNPRRSLNRVLAAFILSLFLWLVANLLSNLAYNPNISIIFAKVTLLGPMLASYFFFILAQLFVDKRPTIRKVFIYATPLLPVIILSPTSLNIVSISAHGKNTVVGLLYLYAIPLAAVYLFSGLLGLLLYHKRTDDPAKKIQIKYMLLGVFATAIPAIILNGIMPLLGSYEAILYGPNSVVLMAVFMSIALLKHQLLDVRAIVARTVAYVLLVASTSGVYVLLTGLVANLIFDDSFSRVPIQIITVTILIFTVEPLRRTLNRITSKVFYQDAYDSQRVINDLGKILVTEKQLKKVINRSTELIASAVKAQTVTYVLYQDREKEDHHDYVISSLPDINESTEYLHELKSLHHARILSVEGMERQGKLYEVLKGLKANVSVKLMANQKLIGYLFFGPKKSGSIFSSQDYELIEIAADEIAIAIQNALYLDKIQSFNETLQEKVNVATRELRKTNEKLKELDEAKDEFISMASHQLRTPLTSVKGYLSMLSEGDAGKLSSSQKKFVDQAFFSSQRMVYLIADLLNVSRLKTGKFVIESAPTQLADVIETEIAQVQESAKSHNLELTFKKPANFPVLNLDETKIRQVIMNFTDNAIYYTPAGGHITLTLEDKGESVEFRVQDDGIGVPKAEQHHLFGKFYRAGNARKARPDGTGLGLFMAKKVVVAQGGAILFTSEEGKGSTFGFSFPKAKLLVTSAK